MFSPKLLKFAVTGAVSVILLVTAVTGANRFGADDSGSGNENDSAQVVDELTEIIVYQWCSQCDKRLYPVVPEELQHWRGRTREELEALIAAEYPEASVLSFEPGKVVVQFLAVTCAECAQPQWPQQGYISLTEDNAIGIYHQDGSLFVIYGSAPGAALELLEEDIHFTSPEDCEQWLINLTS